MKKFFFAIFFFISLIFYSQYAFSLGIRSNSGTFLERIDFQPNMIFNYNYFIVPNDGYTADYELFVETKTEELQNSVEIIPNKFFDVSYNEEKPFSVRLKLPEKINNPGENEINVWVRGISKDSTGGLIARPVVGLRYLIYVLYPWKFVEWHISLKPINLNEIQDFSIKVKNLGEPLINKIYADIEIYNSENQLLQKIKTNEIYNLKSKEEKFINASFDSNGLLAGNYYAIAYLNYDGNISNKTYEFVIGQKNVKILNFTKKIEYKRINKFEIEVKSEWNNKIDKAYAVIDIFSKDKKTKITSFRSYDTSLERLEEKKLESYFDATNIEKGKYIAVVNLFYDGSSTTLEDFVTIDENINQNIVSEIPGKISFKTMIQNITLINVLIFLLIIFVLLSLYLGFTILVSKNKNEKNEKDIESNRNAELKENLEKKEEVFYLNDFDEETIKKINELRKLFSDSEIKEKLIKKGWNPKKVDSLFEKINKQ